MMKRMISILLTVATLVGILPVSVFAENSVATRQDERHPFADVASDSWYEEYVQYVWENGLFVGTSDSKYAPGGTLTRAMFVTALGRMEGIDQAAYTETVFSDVKSDSWYGPYVAWAAQECITYGIGEDRFAPNEAVTREQMAVFIHRYLNDKGENAQSGELTYHDSEEISDYALKSVTVCSAIGIFEGDNHGNFNPWDNATRAEAAAVFARLHEYIKSTDSEVTEYWKVSFAYPDAMEEALKNSTTMEDSVMVQGGSLIYTLAEPVAMGYVFAGWFYDSALTQLAATTDTVTADMTLYPKMVQCSGSEEEEWPEYALNYIISRDVAPDFTVQVQAKSEEQIRNSLTFKAFSEEDGEIDYDIIDEGNGVYTLKPVGGLVAGGSYQIAANDRQSDPVFDADGNIVESDYVLFLCAGEAQPSTVEYHNITVAIEEHSNMRIDNNVIFLPFAQVSGINLEDVTLYTMSEEGFEISDKTDTFTYDGNALSVGDVVAIYDGVLDEETLEVDGELAYVKITEINGNTYTYGMPGLQEVIFTALTLPVPLDDPDTEEVDGAFFNEDGSITVYNEYLDFSAFAEYEELALNGETTAEVGDYLALYTGDIETASDHTYYEITDIRYGENSAVTIFTVVQCEEVESVSVYEVYTGDLGITEEAVAELEAEAEKQAIESGFAEEAANYLAAVMLSGEEMQGVISGYSIESVSVMNKRSADREWYEGGEWNPEIGEEQSLTIEAGAIEAGVGTLMVEVGKVDVHVDSSRTLEEITAMEEGLRLELGLTFAVQIGNYVVGTGWADCVTLQVSASFVQEVAFSPFAEIQEIKGEFLGIPYTKEFRVKAGVDIGTYVGIGGTFTVIAADDFDSTFPWEQAIRELDPDYDPAFPNVDSIARQIREMMSDETTFALGNGEESLVSIYQDLLSKEIDYVEILAIRCPGCPIKIPLPYKIGHVAINLELVISAKMSVTVGVAMETLSVRRYEFNAWINIEEFEAGYGTNSMDLQTPYSEMNLYLMGNLGLRVGPRISLSIHLLSVGSKKMDLANAGFSVYFGYTVDMYGIFFSHLRVENGEVTEGSRCIGALEANHGIFLDLDFHLGVIFDLISVDIHALDLTWNILDKKGTPKVFEPTQRTHTAQMWNTYPYQISNDLLKLNTLVVKTGQVGQRTGLTYKNFNVELSNPLFSYNASDGSISVTDPGDSTKEVCEVRLTYLGSDTLFITSPITITIQLTWEKTWPTSFVRFCNSYFQSDSGYCAIYWETPVLEYRFVEGETITGIVPPVREIAGYDFLGWYYMGDTLEGVENLTLLSDLNNLEGYIMPSGDINIAPMYKARDDTPFTLNYYVETVAGTGAYELYKTVTHQSTTDAYIPAAGLQNYAKKDLGEMDGFKLRYDLLPTDESGRIIGYVKVYGDGSGSGDIYFDREDYSVYYHVGNDDYKGASVMHVHDVYGAALTATPQLAAAAVSGWSFAGWTDGEGNAVEIPDTVPSDTGKASVSVDGTYYAGGTHYFAQWEPSFNYYTVNHYLKNPDGGYDLIESQVGDDSNPTYGGYTGDYIKVSQHIKTVEGATFSHYVCTTADGVETTRIAGVSGTGAGDRQHNGQVLNLYYDREYFRVYWESANGELLQYYYTGQTIFAPEGLTAEGKAGYMLDGWKNIVVSSDDDGQYEIYREGDGLTMGERYMRFVPNYVPATGTKYTIIYKLPAIGTYSDYSDESLWETVVGYGTTDTLITAPVKEYEGYVTPEAKQFYIRGDGSSSIVYEYTRQKYTLTLDFAGGTELGYARSYSYGLSFQLPLQVSRDGYEFKGWLLTTEGCEADVDDYDGYVFGSCLTSMKDLTFVAQWEAIDINYTVEHYLQELDGSYAEPRVITLTATVGTEVTAQPSEFVGFTFDASNALNVTTGILSDSGGTIVDADGDVTALRLYYSRNSYTVTWHDYDGSELAYADYLYGADITVPEGMAEPQRTGYTFGGWKDFGTMGTSDASFYAETDGTWNANSYTVRFHANGGTGTMEDQSFVYGVAQNLSANTFQYVNRNFIGWSTTPEGEVQYANKHAVSDLTAENGAVVTLYAVWELMEGATAQYTVAHYTESLAGGYEKYSETTGYGLIEKEVTLTASDAVSITGFTFDPDANNVLTASVREDGSTVFEMYYSRNSYNLTLDYGDEQIKVAIEDEDFITHIVTKEEDPDRAIADQVISVRYGENLSAYLTDLEDQIGYTFAGWDNSNTTMPAEDILATAQWTAVEVTVTFHPGTCWFFPDDADLDAAAVTQTYRYGEEVTAPEGLLEQFRSLLSSTSYAEAGWIFSTTQGSWPTLSHFPMILVEGYYSENPVLREYATDEDGNYLYDENNDYVYTDQYSVVVAPFWSSCYDVVAFDANGGEGSMASMNVDGYGYRALPTCTFTREGYVFAGWNTASDGSGTSYGIYDSFYGNGADVTTTTLYAQWEKVG